MQDTAENICIGVVAVIIVYQCKGGRNTSKARLKLHQPNNSILELLSSVVVWDSWEDKIIVKANFN